MNPGSATPVTGRIFLVGCGRSGTTLLQSLLGSHPRIASFPESEFFMSVVGYLPGRMYGRPARSVHEKLRRVLSEARVRLGIAAGAGRGMVEWYLNEIGRPDLMDLFPAGGRALRPQLQACMAMLDRMAEERGKPIWLEKTPLHLGYADIIRDVVPTARFIHILRNGPDVVASLYDVSQRYPEQWAASYSSLDDCITQWNHSVSLTEKYLGEPSHAVVRYEDLVSHTRPVLEDLCRFLQIEYDDGMLDSYAKTAKHVVRGEEKWKDGVAAPIRNANGTKFYEVFDEQQQEYVLSRLLRIDWDGAFSARAGARRREVGPGTAASAAAVT